MKKFLAVILVVMTMMSLLTGCDRFIFFTTGTKEETTTVEPTTLSEIETLYNDGVKYLQEAKYEDAISAFTQVITLDGNRLDAYIYRGDAYFELAKTKNAAQNLQAAVSDYTTAINKGSAAEETKLYDCYVKLASNSYKNDKAYDALLYYQKAYEINKTDPSVALAQKLWMYKLDTGYQVTYFGFNYDNTGYIFENDSVYSDQSSTYSVSGNSVLITDAYYNTYNWEYNSSIPGFTSTAGSVEMITAKSAFTDWYNNTAYALSNTPYGWTQSEMNQAAKNEYDTWDVLLNVIYFYLIDILPENEAIKLNNDEVDWIEEKETAMTNAENEYKGGTIAPLMKYSTGAKYTKSRVEELINMMPTPQ